VHIPPNANESPDELLQQFGDTLRLIERLRPRLEYFAEKLHAAGATMCAIEYKVEAGALQIIDWDTADDSSVIEALNSRDE